MALAPFRGHRRGNPRGAIALFIRKGPKRAGRPPYEKWPIDRSADAINFERAGRGD